MAIKIKFDNELRALPPTLVLATRSGHKLGCIPAQHIVFHGSLANGYELSCSVNKYDNWEKTELWDKLEDFKLAWSPEWDVWFELDITTNEADDTTKNITATSIGETELSQVMLYNIEINTETDIAREDYKPTIIYDPKDHTDSLLDRIMEKTPHYKIRHVDSSIAKLQRTFTFDGKSLRDALLEICKEVNALLIIHSGTDANGKIERAYSIYDLEEHCLSCGYRGEQVDGKCPECGKTEWSFGYGDDTGIFVSSENLADDITYETAKDSVKNCFRLVAGDDLMTAAVAAANPNGTGYLWYISDKVREDMSPALRNRLKEYDDLYQATENSPFSFTSVAIGNYNTLAAKYGKNQIGTVEKFAGVLDAYYDTIDFELYLEHGLLPDVSPPLATAAGELQKLIANISPVSVRTLSTLSLTTATSYVAQAARSIVDPRYSVSTKDETLNGNFWSGSFIITRYSDEEDTATSATVSVSLDENYENFIRRQIDRILNNSSEFEDLDIVSLFEKDGAAFASEIKHYSLAMLKTFYDACQACLNVLVEHNSANESIWAEIYHDLYEPYYAKLGYLQSEITLREAEIATVQAAQAEIASVITSTQEKLDFEKFMGEELWLELAAYRREDTYQNDNYISDGLDNAALVDNARKFLKTAQEEIERSATLQHSISANLNNLLVMEDFRGITDGFELGNWLRIKVDDKVYILRLIDYEIDFDNLEKLNVEYSDVIESPSSANDIKSVLNSASSMASSYGSVSRQARHGDNSQRQLNSWVTDGLEATKIRFLSDAENQNITWDENGMLFRKWDEVNKSYEPTQLRIINSTVAVTDDNWKTVKTAVGGFDYKDPVTGEIKHGYGINAELLIGKLILGEELGLYNENNSLTFNRDGLTITNGNNSFTVSPNGSNLLSVECGKDNKVMWVDEDGGLHLRPTSFELSSGQTIEDITDDALEKFKENVFDPAYQEMINSIDSKITPEAVFNKLTNYGNLQGLFVERDGKVYLNAEYIGAGTIVGDFIRGGTIQGVNLTIGGIDNSDGRIEVKGADGKSLGVWDNAGLNITKGSIVGTNITLGGEDNIYGNLQILDYLSTPTTILNQYGLHVYDWRGEGTLCQAHIGNGVISFGKAISDGLNTTIMGLIPTVSNGYNSYIRDIADIQISIPADYSYGATTYPPHFQVMVSTGSGANDVSSLYVGGDGYVRVNSPNGFYVNSLMVLGGKSRAVETENYGARLLSAMESPTPVFSDMGSATCDDNGTAFVSIDSIFSETIERGCVYRVFFTQIGSKSVYRVEEKESDYFTVIGEPGAKFDWIIYAPQMGYQNDRLQEIDSDALNDFKKSKGEAV